MAFVCLHVGFKAGTYKVCNVDIDNTENIARKMFFQVLQLDYRRILNPHVQNKWIATFRQSKYLTLSPHFLSCVYGFSLCVCVSHMRLAKY